MPKQKQIDMFILDYKVSIMLIYIEKYPQQISVFQRNHDEIMELVSDDLVSPDLLEDYINSILKVKQ